MLFFWFLLNRVTPSEARLARSALTPTTAETQAFFERVATDWDTLRLAYYDESVIERMWAHSGISGEARSSMRVVDGGTGTGFATAGLAPRVDWVTGVDDSPAVLRTARENLDALGMENAELVRGDLSALPLTGGSVDAAFANMVLHHAEDPSAMLAEMARVARPGGSVVIADEVEHPYEWMRREHADVWRGFSEPQVAGFFEQAGLAGYGYESLGMQRCIHSTTSGEVAGIAIFAAWDRRPSVR